MLRFVSQNNLALQKLIETRCSTSETCSLLACAGRPCVFRRLRQVCALRGVLFLFCFFFFAPRHACLFALALSVKANGAKTYNARTPSVDRRTSLAANGAHVRRDAAVRAPPSVAAKNRRVAIDATPLHVASANGDDDIVALLLARSNDVNIVDKKGWTPLHLAARHCRTAIVTRLLDAGANVNAVPPESQQTALHLASISGADDIVALLLARGADVSLVDVYGRTPLYERISVSCWHHRASFL